MSCPRDLFGGAIVAECPPGLVDASDLRQIPDTQEVFMYPQSSVSIIVEILQKVEPDGLNDAIRFHFDSLAHDNSAQSSEVEKTSSITAAGGNGTPAPTVLSGVQLVPKFNRTEADKVKILMALFRIDAKAIDLVVTFNIPLTSGDGGHVDASGLQRAELDFDTFVRSLRIVDFGLFA